MNKDELVQSFIFKVEDTFRDCTPSFIPSEVAVATYKRHWESFIRYFPEFAGQYDVKEPPADDLAEQHKHWIHKTVALISQGIIHPELLEKINQTPELIFFAGMIKRNQQANKQELRSE
jgi:hypothetical protein